MNLLVLVHTTIDNEAFLIASSIISWHRLVLEDSVTLD